MHDGRGTVSPDRQCTCVRYLPLRGLADWVPAGNSAIKVGLPIGIPACPLFASRPFEPATWLLRQALVFQEASKRLAAHFRGAAGPAGCT